jgi:hypothetical protein
MARARARIGGAGQHAPALRDRIDLAFLVGVRTERRAVVEIGAAIPLAIPCILLDVGGDAARLFAALGGKGGVMPQLGHFGKALQHFAQEEGQPHALALAMLAHLVHAVVPVAGTDQRQAVLPQRKPWRMARTQWSYSVPRSPERAGRS